MKYAPPPVTAWSGRRVDFLWLSPRFGMHLRWTGVHFTASSDHLPVLMDVKMPARVTYQRKPTGLPGVCPQRFGRRSCAACGLVFSRVCLYFFARFRHSSRAGCPSADRRRPPHRVFPPEGFHVGHQENVCRVQRALCGGRARHSRINRNFLRAGTRLLSLSLSPPPLVALYVCDTPLVLRPSRMAAPSPLSGFSFTQSAK